MGKRGIPVQPITEARLLSKVAFEPMSGCWLWIGSTFQRQPYGRITVGGRLNRKHLYAHRVAWDFFVGAIPDGVDVLHRCDVPQCINPLHLFLGSHADNMRDMSQKGRCRPWTTRLCWADVETIRSLAGRVSNMALAKRFGVRVDHVSDIIHGRAWRVRPAA